jgi:hypothetical protein
MLAKPLHYELRFNLNISLVLSKISISKCKKLGAIKYKIGGLEQSSN